MTSLAPEKMDYWAEGGTCMLKSDGFISPEKSNIMER